MVGGHDVSSEDADVDSRSSVVVQPSVAEPSIGEGRCGMLEVGWTPKAQIC